jgi:hypothetical protein
METYLNLGFGHILRQVADDNLTLRVSTTCPGGNLLRGSCTRLLRCLLDAAHGSWSSWAPGASALASALTASSSALGNDLVKGLA